MTNKTEQLNGKEYQSVNALFAIPIGQAFNVQNIGPSKVKFHIGDARPEVSTLNFRVLPALPEVLLQVPSREKEVFLLGNSQINAEVD